MTQQAEPCARPCRGRQFNASTRHKYVTVNPNKGHTATKSGDLNISQSQHTPSSPMDWVTLLPAHHFWKSPEVY